MGNVILNDWTIPAAEKQPRAIAPRPARPILARYDAAILDDDSRRHWANADALSAKSANSTDVRERLRNNSRYEIANNCYAYGIGRTLADAIIGYGPTLSFRRPPGLGRQDADDLRTVARLFSEWAEEINLWGKLHLMRFAKYADGEAFGLLRTNRRLEAVELDLQLIEADQVSHGYAAADNFDPRRVDGIETDDLGNVIAYKVLREHPGDGADYALRSLEPITARPAQMCHWFTPKRPGELRAVPETTPALPLFAQLRRFTLATLTAAETAANHAAVLKHVAQPSEDSPQYTPFETVEIERGMWVTLPEGLDIGQLKAEHPTTTYDTFKRELLCEVGRAMQLPRMLVLLDASGYNYSSGRLDHQATGRFIETEQYQCELQVLRMIWRAWIAEARRIVGFLPARAESGELRLDPRWLWRQLGHVDRVKEASGADMQLASNTTTLAVECAREGLDWEEVAEQRAEERRRLAELGLDQGTAPIAGDINRGAATAANNDGGNDENEE